MNITAYRTICPFNKINDDFIKYILQQPINPDGGGTSNLICPTCFYREGHQKIYCCKCGDKYVKFNKFNKSIFNYQWILSATSEEEKIKRSGMIMCSFSIEFKNNNKKLPWVDQEKYFKNVAESL